MADIKVNMQQWNSVSIADQEIIIKGLRESGALKIGDNIVADPAVQPFDENAHFVLKWNPFEDLCKMACDTAAAAAFTWCSANTAGAATVVCMAAAEAARNACRDNC